MLAAIQAFANMVPVTPVDPTLVVSQSLALAQGTVASGASRFDTNVIAKYEFETGTGLVAYDTSGVDPSRGFRSALRQFHLGRRMGRLDGGRRRQGAGPSTSSSRKIP